MGSICCPQSEPPAEPTGKPTPSSVDERAPLLGGITSPVIKQPQPGHRPSQSARFRSSLTEDEQPELGHRPSQSARFRSSLSEGDLEPAVTDSSEITTIEIKTLGIAAVDKQLQVDHVDLYNEYVKKYHEMCVCRRQVSDGSGLGAVTRKMEEISATFTEEAWRHVKVNRRYKHCVEVRYEGQFMEEDAVHTLRKFNRANVLVKELLDKKSPLVDSVQIVIDSEERIKRDVFVHCTDSEFSGQGPQLWALCHANIRELRRVRPGVERMSTEASGFFDEMVEAVQVLCRVDYVTT